MTAPFGIALYSPISDLDILAELDDSRYGVQPSLRHPDFGGYIGKATPCLGVVGIRAVGSAIEDDEFGIKTRAAVDKIYGQLSRRYGTTKKMDFLMPGSEGGKKPSTGWLRLMIAKESIRIRGTRRIRLSYRMTLEQYSSGP